MSPNSLIRLMSLKHAQSKTLGCFTQKVYEGGWEATTEQQLIDRIHRKLREFDLKCVESLIRGVNAKVKSIGQHGVFSLFKK